MTQNLQEIIQLKEDISECMRRGVSALVADASKSGGFKAYGDNRPDELAVLQGYGAWTTAEGILAVLHSEPFLHDFKNGPDIDFLAMVTNNLVCIQRNFKEDGVPADPDFGISHRGVIDSTVKVLLALLAVRHFVISKGWDRLTNWKKDIVIPLIKIDSIISDLSQWVMSNQNEDGSWGLWKGTEGRTYPTFYAIKVLLDCGEKPKSEQINKAIRWINSHQLEDGGWGFSTSENTSDLASTSFAILALTQVGPLWGKEIWKGEKLLQEIIKQNNYDDTPKKMKIPIGGMSKNVEIPVIHPTKPRLLCALLQAGMSPFSAMVQHLLKQICCEELDAGGWASVGEKELQTWYTYVVIDSFTIWFSYAEELGKLPYYIFEGKLSNYLYKQLKAVSVENQYLHNQIELLTQKNISTHKLNIGLIVETIVLIIFLTIILFSKFDILKAVLVLGGFLLTIVLGVIANYFYELLKKKFVKKIKNIGDD